MAAQSGKSSQEEQAEKLMKEGQKSVGFTKGQ